MDMEQGIPVARVTGIVNDPNQGMDSACSCNDCGDIDIQQTLNDIDQAMESFSNEAPADDDTVKEAKKTLGSLLDYIRGNDFRNWVNRTANEYKVPPKKVATNFISKALGLIGDVLGIAIATVGNVAHTLVNIVNAILHGAVNGIVAVANGITGVISLNQTNIIPAN